MPRPTHPGPPPALVRRRKTGLVSRRAGARRRDASASGRISRPRATRQQAIAKLVAGLQEGRSDQVLLGVTGSGKTFTIAKVIEAVNRPTLVLSHNKTLAAQLYQEFRSFFPENSVEYFVSYYDYYQPEAYVPQTDTYIEKDATRNEEIDKLRLSASKALFERRDVVVVASVSCIYGLGAPDSYYDMLAYLEVGDARGMPALLAQLVEMQYERTNLDLARGTFRVRGDVLEVAPAYEDTAVRVEFFGDEIEKITRTDPLRGTPLQRVDRLALYPRTFYATPRETLERAIGTIRLELDARLAELTQAGRLLEAQRLHQRTMFDLEMIKELGYCSGIENYSRHLSGRAPGEPPPTLLDYFPEDFLLVVDESHVTLPAGARDVLRRPVAQAGPRRLRLPPALGPGQPPADLRRVPAARPPGHRRERHAGRRGARARRRRDRGAGHPPDRPSGPGHRDPAGQGPGRRPAGGRPGGRRPRTSASS